MVDILEYLIDNKSGSINGQEYNIRDISNSDLEELIQELEELINNGDK